MNEKKLNKLIKDIATEHHLPIQQVYSLFGLETLLKKVNSSAYNDYFIVKGGYLLSTVYGLQSRSTIDLDTTIRRMPLNKESVEEFISFLETPNENGVVQFTRTSIRETRENFDYQGFKVKLNFLQGKTRIPIILDITTGETILPPVEKLSIPLLFSDGSIHMTGYSTEQILADKLYTTLAYGAVDDTNSRSKDLYDIHLLTKLQKNDINYSAVKNAINTSIKQRKAQLDSKEHLKIISYLAQSEKQQELWNIYRQQNNFAKDILFEDIISSLKNFSTNVFV